MKAVIIHPAFGTVYMYDCKIVDGYIIGVVGKTRDTMNFPVSCIKEITAIDSLAD